LEDSREEPKVRSNSTRCRPLKRRKLLENLTNEVINMNKLISQINDYLKIDSLIFVSIN
jgi:hypothetical protein